LNNESQQVSGLIFIFCLNAQVSLDFRINASPRKNSGHLCPYTCNEDKTIRISENEINSV